MAEVVIKIEDLKKQYRLGTIGGSTLTAELQSWWAKKIGKDDPNQKIGTNTSKVGEMFYALNGINLEVHQGEALGIIGTNGAGKSTLLKLLSRVTAPSEGIIKMNGRIASMLEVGTGFHQELTGRENIYMNGAILGMTRKEIDSKLEDIIDFSECRQFIDTPVKRYSSGMYVKLAFAVAAHLDAEIMIMDEVLAVGDMKFQQKCLGKMGDASGHEGKTVLYVSHNMNTIRQLCTRCVVLNHGKLIYDGDVEEGIQCYMESENIDLPVYYDLESTKRPSLDHGNGIHIHSFEIIDRKEAVFVNDPIIRFKLKWFSLREEEVMYMCIPVKYADGTPVGLAQSCAFRNSGENTENEGIFELDLSNLADGKYYFHIDMYSVNQFGTHNSWDNTSGQKIYIEIKNDLKDKIEWHRNSWGSVMLSEITCRSL